MSFGAEIGTSRLKLGGLESGNGASMLEFGTKSSDKGFEAGIWAWRMGFGPWARILTWGLRFGLGG